MLAKADSWTKASAENGASTAAPRSVGVLFQTGWSIRRQSGAGLGWFLPLMRERFPMVFGAKALLLAVTILLMASMGGGYLLLLPLLIPAHVWAARRSGRVGRIVWSLLPAMSVGMVTWAAVYVVVGESEPAIWLVPAIALAAGWGSIVRAAGRRSPSIA